ncbi:unnamed protein product [Allacma fusca]|uniref:Uncharacterized protein n=1 Tax=Allacma fusca TaxID=39272 RepID=A0A8J2PAI9_9HEXA|nr:unnamed protein product [Allacma fusca]
MQINPGKKPPQIKVEPDKKIIPKDNTSKKSVNITGVSGQGQASSLAENAQKRAYSSLASIMSKSRDPNGSLSSKKATWKKKPVKPYEPIRLPKEILTIQAHSASTPVTELPYLLIAAHIGSLQSTRQFYPTTSSSNTPLTVFHDMFVMTMDVRGYKPSSVRLSTEGRLIIIECLQSEVPPVRFTQTGTVDANDKYVMDPTPSIQQMPVHTTFNYTQHRVKLPEDFSEEGLKVGMDEVTGHVIITGRLVHNHNAAFPESWNTSAARKTKGPIVNTSSSNLSSEDARKLAAWHAVQGHPQQTGEILGATGTPILIGCERKQWLEKESAKLRALQHKSLKENIQKLTDLKKAPADAKKHSAMQGLANNSGEAKTAVVQDSLHKASNSLEHKQGSAIDILRTSPAPATFLGPAGTAFVAKMIKSDPHDAAKSKSNDSKPKVVFQPSEGSKQLSSPSSVISNGSKGKASNNIKPQQKDQSNNQPKPKLLLNDTKQTSNNKKNKDPPASSKTEQPLLDVQGKKSATPSFKTDEAISSHELKGSNSENDTKTSGPIEPADAEDISNLSLIVTSSSTSSKNLRGKSSTSTNLQTEFNNILGTNIANYQASGSGGTDVTPFRDLSPKRENSPSSSPLVSQSPAGGPKITSPGQSPNALAANSLISSGPPTINDLTPKINETTTSDGKAEPGNSSKSSSNVVSSNNEATKKLLSCPGSKSELSNLAGVDLEELSELQNPELEGSEDPIGKEDKSLWEKLLLHAQAGASNTNEE